MHIITYLVLKMTHQFMLITDPINKSHTEINLVGDV